MFKITIKNIIRSFLRHLNISLISLVGLSLGFTIFIFIAQYILYEKSFDKFWNSDEQIYRVTQVSTRDGNETYNGVRTCRGIYFAKDEIPEADACGYAFYESCQIHNKPHALFEQDVLWVSYGFQEVFNFEMAEGVADFEKTHTGILSERKAKILFGNESPVGKIIKVNEGMPIEITGVFKNIPSNTHLVADYFISSRTWIDYGWISEQGNWNGNGWWYTYFKLKEDADPRNVESKLADLVKVHLPNLKNQNRTVTYGLQSLKDIHFDQTKKGDRGKKANKKSLLNLLMFGAFVLLVAWINYVNLSTALAIKKEKSIGMQKLVGASSFQQIMYVVLDNLMFNILAGVLAWLFYFITSGIFANAFEIPIQTSYIPVGLLIAGFVLVVLIGVVLSSVYSALTILRINPFVRKIKMKEGVFQRGLIIAQLCITILFISMSTLIYQQIRFVQNYNLGMDIEQVLVLSAPTSFNGQENPRRPENPKFDTFKNFRKALAKLPYVQAVTSTNNPPGREMMGVNVSYSRPNSDIGIKDKFSNIFIDSDYIKTFGIELLAGKPLPDNKYRYGKLALINEKARKSLGFETPEEAIGQQIQRGRARFEIYGVVKNFHFEGLQKEIYPVVMEYNHPTEFGYYPVRVNPENISASVDHIETVWKKYYPNDPFNCFFQDDYYNMQYQSFNRIAKFNIVFAILSIFISCLGLYGIIMFYIARKIKEIGIRKVNGAPVSNILFVLNKNILIWFTIAMFIAIPAGIYLMQQWLSNFAYRTEIEWWIFASAGILAVGVSLLTISWQSWKAATRNPVEALRYE